MSKEILTKDSSPALCARGETRGRATARPFVLEVESSRHIVLWSLVDLQHEAVDFDYVRLLTVVIKFIRALNPGEKLA